MAFDHVEALFPGQRHHRLAGQTVQEAVGRRRVQRPIADEEHVGPRRLGHIAAIVEHHRVGVAVALGGVLGEGADHVQARGLGVHRRHVGAGPAVLGPGQADALGLLLGLEVAGPVPHGDGHVDAA